jgi:beta-lactamase class A
MKEIPRGKRRITAGAPSGLVVWHRPGTMPGTANDTGIIQLPNGEHVVIAVFTKGSKRSALEEREDDIAAVTKPRSRP